MSKLVKDAETLGEYSENILTKASIDTSDLRSILIAALFSKICSGHRAIFELIKLQYSIEAEIVVRCNIESLIWMGVCCKSELGYKKYLAKDKAELEKLRNATRDKRHIYSKLLRDGIQQIWEELEGYVSEHDEKPYSTEVAAQEANVEAYYAYLYRMHSAAIHTPPAYLMQYFVKHDETEISSINVGPIPTRTEDVLYGSNIALSHAIEWYAKYFKIELNSTFIKMADRYRKNS